MRVDSIATPSVPIAKNTNMKYIKYLIIAVLAITNVSPAVAQAPEGEPLPIVEITTEYELRLLVDEYALKHGVSAGDMKRVIGCESGWNPKIQSRHKYNQGQVTRNPQWGVTVGEYERSFGLVQIHLPAHPTVTEEMATDPDFAIEFMAKAFSNGYQSWWTCH